MSREISVSASLAVVKGSVNFSRNITPTSPDFNGTLSTGGIVSIGTGATQVPVGSGIGTAGWALFINTDATNYLTIGSYISATYYAFAKLKPGEMTLCRLVSTTVYAQANTAACNLEYYIFAD